MLVWMKKLKNIFLLKNKKQMKISETKKTVEYMKKKVGRCVHGMSVLSNGRETATYTTPFCKPIRFEIVRLLQLLICILR